MGPTVFFHAPASVDVDELQDITELMDLYKSDFNIHIVENKKSANLFFEIPSVSARGNAEMLQISIVVDINVEINLGLARELLEGFAKAVKDIEDCYKAFYIGNERLKGDKKIYKKLKNTFFAFCISIDPAVKALKEAELRYQALFNAARDAIIIFEHETQKIVHANEQAGKIFGSSRESLISMALLDLPFVGNTDIILSEIFKQTTSEKLIPIIITVNSYKDIEVPLEVNASEIKIANNRFVQIICRDITERMVAEQKLKESEKKYRELVENVNSIILKWDFDGRIIYINDYGERFFGYNKEKLKGQHVIGTIVPQTETSGRNLKILIDDICANPDNYEKNINENMTKSGKKVWISWTNSALYDESGNMIGVVSVGTDITDSKIAKNSII
jgi:PAS domain S-box-containing protein